jgi:hypothetical protein
MASIRVQKWPGVKTSRLPAGVSSRGNWRNNLYLGKQMTAGFTLLVRPETETLGCSPIGIVKSAQEWADGSPRQGVPSRCLSGMR